MFYNKLRDMTWQSECDMQTPYRVMTAQIGFAHEECSSDEVEFCIVAWDTESFPTIKEIEHRLKVIANQEILTDKNADYFDWEQYGSLEEQRKYFSEIILNTLKR